VLYLWVLVSFHYPFIWFADEARIRTRSSADGPSAALEAGKGSGLDLAGRNTVAINPSKISRNIRASTGSRTESSNPCGDIVDHCRYAWNTPVDRHRKIMAIALRQWARE
jgi:hypothetical protein